MLTCPLENQLFFPDPWRPWTVKITWLCCHFICKKSGADVSLQSYFCLSVTILSTWNNSCQCGCITVEVHMILMCSLCIRKGPTTKVTILFTQRTRYTLRVMNCYVNMCWRILASSGMALTIAYALVSGSLHSLRRTFWTAHFTLCHMWANWPMLGVLTQWKPAEFCQQL